MDLVKLDINDLSSIKCEFYIINMPSIEGMEVLVIRFIGECGYGSEGNSDALYMSAMVAAGIKAWDHYGLILDLSELRYEFGNSMLNVAYPPSDLLGDWKNDNYPFAVTISDTNRAGLTSLIKEMKNIDPKDFFFDSFDQALIRVDEMAKDYY